jgi:hypothetical protein
VRFARSIGRFLALLLSLALLLGLFGAPAWFVVISTVQRHLTFDLPILGAGAIASVILWLTFPQALRAFFWSSVISISATSIGVAALFLAHLYWQALAAVYLAFCIAITPPIMRMTWSLRSLPLSDQRQLLREARPLHVLLRSFLLWELRHAPVEERLAWLRRAATSLSEPAATATDADADAARD